jgi:hypothetical protein
VRPSTTGHSIFYLLGMRPATRFMNRGNLQVWAVHFLVAVLLGEWERQGQDEVAYSTRADIQGVHGWTLSAEDVGSYRPAQ